MGDIYYKKNDNTKLFEDFEKYGISNVQNYIPIYRRFFSLNDKNFNNINLDISNSLTEIHDKQSENVYNCSISNGDVKNKTKTFLKFSPLIDPIKYMAGKYSSLDDETLTKLPKLEDGGCHKKLLDYNNSAYTDSFFTYLTSKLLHKNNFIHGIDFYGSYLSIKKNFEIELYDDLEFLDESEYFHENKYSKFDVKTTNEDVFLDFNSRNNKKKIRISCDLSVNIVNEFDSQPFDDVFTVENVKNLSDVSYGELNELIYENDMKSTSISTKSNCSSRSSNTSLDENDLSDDLSDELSNNSETDNESSEESVCSSDIQCSATIKNFPVEVISLEYMDQTLDSLLDDDLSIDEWSSCLFQIIMMLVTYQKVYSLTHNDLHTNNVMFNKTDKKYIIYKYDNKFYKVPTFGRLFKIIDFGRAIYRFKNKIICSDSFNADGDAATQYNCEPYINNNKPRLEPNFSFDLCRLGCSLYDYFEEVLGDEFETNPVSKFIIKLCTDDKNKNVLYKKNGEERYPDFKLYKMIARTVNKHVPKDYINYPLFSKFLTTKKNIGKRRVMNIDTYTKGF